MIFKTADLYDKYGDDLKVALPVFRDYGEKKIFQAILRSLVDVFPHVRIYKSFNGKGFHFLASKEPFETPLSKD